MEWLLYWIELSEPVETPDGFLLPTLLVVGDPRGVPLAPPELLPELDQVRAEIFLSKLIEKFGRPEGLTISSSDDWEEDAWKSFSAEHDVAIRFQKIGSHEASSIIEVIKSGAGREDSERNSNAAARGLLRTASGLRSRRRRGDYLRKAVELDPGLSGARIELADLEFGCGKWKNSLAAYEEVFNREMPIWHSKKYEDIQWWENHETRPFLRSIHGMAMTLWHQGKHLDAADEFAKLLEINPTDHQGARFFLPLIFLLADQAEDAAVFFQHYEENYAKDFADPALLFAWGLSLHRQGEEARARAKYQEAMIKNFFIAPMLLEVEEPVVSMWYPTDRAEPAYAEEFIESYATLWDRDPGALRLVREVWNEMIPIVEPLIAHRIKMLDFQDQRYDPGYRKKWEVFIQEEEKLTTL